GRALGSVAARRPVCGVQRAGLLRGTGRGRRVRRRSGAHPDERRGAAAADRRGPPAAAPHRAGVRRVRCDEAPAVRRRGPCGEPNNTVSHGVESGAMRDLRLSTPAWLVVLASVAGCEHGGVVQPPPPRSPAHYVSPTGSAAGDGSSARPWDLATALAGAAGKVQPGDTIWLRGGIYSPGAPLVSTVAGAAGRPVGTVGNGHGLYVKSDAGPMVLRDNVLFDQFGFGIHAYTDATDGLLNNITVDGNASFNNGLLSGSASGSNVLVGGLAPADGIVVDSNMTYFSPGVAFPNVWLGWSKSQV